MTRLAELSEGLRIALDALRANKLRAALTTLGIVIGILTVTLMGAAIQGLNRAFLKSISAIGADVLYVQRFDWFVDSAEAWMRMQKRRPITLDQGEALGRQLRLARAVLPVAETVAPVKYKTRRSDAIRVIGSTEDYLLTSGVTLAQGRFLSPTEVDGGRPVCVIGSAVATNLFPRESPVGNKIRIGLTAFEVVGVMEQQGTFLGAISLDNQAIIPLRQFIVTFDSRPDYQVQVKVRDLAQLAEAQEELRVVMRRVRRLAPGDPDDFAINQQEQFVRTFNVVAGTIALVGLFITGLSLFVGGIGIMNIMFVSVAERTREIGVRKALGAKRRTILVQFLIEAAVLCLLGGLLGLSIAWPVTIALKKFLPAALSPVVVAAALLVSLMTGVTAGFLPAWRAARMNPVDALRSE